MAAREDDTASPEPADQKVDETVAGAAAAAAAEVDECSDDDDEDDPVIRNLNLMSRRKLMPAEWIENRRKQHYKEIDLYNRSYDALENEDAESDDEAFTAEYEEWSKRHWASIDFSHVNNVGGESRGMDAVAVYPDFLHAPKSEDAAAALRPEEKDEDKDQDADAACAESSS